MGKAAGGEFLEGHIEYREEACGGNGHSKDESKRYHCLVWQLKEPPEKRYCRYEDTKRHGYSSEPALGEPKAGVLFLETVNVLVDLYGGHRATRYMST
jgi:hypothetical protein